MDDWKFVVMLCCFLTIVPASSSELTKHKRLDSGRIVNGVEVEHRQFPFVVSIEVYLAYSSEWTSTCGGSIVNQGTILTACHCTTADEKIHGNIKYLADPRSLRVVAGTGYWSLNKPFKEVRDVQRIVTHPECKNFQEFDQSYLNDVALVFLKQPLDYNAEVSPMRLPSMDMPTAVKYLKDLVDQGASCTTVGWGRTVEYEYAQSQSLQGSMVRLLDPDTCRSRFCRQNHKHCNTGFEHNGQICITSPTSAVCNGDSGGPLVCNGFVVGTVSYGDGCLPFLPAVFQGLRPILEILALNHVRIDTQPAGYPISGVHKPNIGNFSSWPEGKETNELIESIVKKSLYL